MSEKIDKRSFLEKVKAMLESGEVYGQLPIYQVPVVGGDLQITRMGSLGTITSVRDVAKAELVGQQFWVKTDLLGKEVRVALSVPSLDDVEKPIW